MTEEGGNTGTSMDEEYLVTPLAPTNLAFRKRKVVPLAALVRSRMTASGCECESVRVGMRVSVGETMGESGSTPGMMMRVSRYTYESVGVRGSWNGGEGWSTPGIRERVREDL
jgi:hypothetical protein